MFLITITRCAYLRSGCGDTATAGKTGPVIPGGRDTAGINKRDPESRIMVLVLLCYSSLLIYSANFGSLYQRIRNSGRHAERLELYSQMQRITLRRRERVGAVCVQEVCLQDDFWLDPGGDCTGRHGEDDSDSLRLEEGSFDGMANSLQWRWRILLGLWFFLSNALLLIDLRLRHWLLWGGC